MERLFLFFVAVSATASADTQPVRGTSYTIGGSLAASQWWPEFDGECVHTDKASYEPKLRPRCACV